jgi:FkbM family methyltransferase
VDILGLTDVAVAKLEAILLEQAGHRRAVIEQQPVEDTHGIALGEQSANENAADIPCAAHHEHVAIVASASTRHRARDDRASNPSRRRRFCRASGVAANRNTLARVSRRIASAIRARLHSTAYMLRAADGAKGALDVARFLAYNRVPSPNGKRILRVRMRALGGGAIAVRPRTSDMYNAASYYANGLHLPPPGVRDRDLHLIVELGSNIGAALCGLAVRYPHARMIGVEPDAENLRMAQLNLERFGGRVTLVNAGVWDSDATLVVEDSHGAGEHGLTVRAVEPGTRPGVGVEALTIDEILGRHAPGEDVDFMFVNVEGTEPRLFDAGGEWPERVRSLRVELHPYFDYTEARCVPQLEALGYRAWPAPEEPEKWIYAVRRQ